MSRTTIFVALALCGLATARCGGTQHGGESRQIPLGQARAVEVVTEVVDARGLDGPDTNVAATLANTTRVNVDVLVRSLGAGVVWLNEQDRLTTGDIPPPSDRSELYVVRGALGQGQETLLLILQDEEFAYLPNPRADQRRPEDRTIDDVEARLRRDSRDFFQAIIDLRGGQD